MGWVDRRKFLRASVAVLAAPAVVLARGRRELEQDTDFHVAPDGDDDNDGLTAPKRKISAMIHELQRDWDARGCLVRIVCAPGTYDSFSMKGEIVGTVEPLRIIGSVKRGECTIRSDGALNAVYANNASFLIEGFTITAPRSIGLQATLGGMIEYRDIEWGECGLSHVAAAKGGKTYAVSLRADTVTPAYHIYSGRAERHLYVNGGGLAYMTEMMRSHMEFLDQFEFVAFADVIQGGNLTCHTNLWTGPEPKGPAVLCRWNSIAGEALQIPGDQSLNVVDDRSTLIVGFRTKQLEPSITR